MEQTFYSTFFGKNILISISNNDVDFIFVTPENDHSFYDFPKDRWVTFFSKHMKTKSWFTKEMYQFIDKNIQP